MVGSKLTWKKGRGKLGMFIPLIGRWQAVAESPFGVVTSTRQFEYVLEKAYIQLTANWVLPQGAYQELALIGVGLEGQVQFWSFTSDRKQSFGRLADVSEVHPEAIGFEAQMPAGLARMAYYPDEVDGFHWVVEALNKSGWKRVTEHHYHAFHG